MVLMEIMFVMCNGCGVNHGDEWAFNETYCEVCGIQYRSRVAA